MPKKQREEISSTETPLGQIKQNYYTAKEAYERLGLTRDAFNSMVRRKPEDFGKKILWRGHGYYSKERIDVKKQEIEALLLGDNRVNFIYEPVSDDELDQEDHMAYLNFGSGSLSPARKKARREYLKANPYSTLHLYDGNQLIAFLNLIPMKHEAIVEFRKGVRGWTFPVDMIEQFEPGHRLECIIIDMATITNAPPEKRNRFAGYLLHHVALQLAEWGKRGVDIATIDACGGTFEGKKILQKAGFEFTGTFKTPAINKPDVLVDRDMYHLDIDSTDSPLLHKYKQSIQEWKRLHQ
ncbi:MAG TPA: hypothetical protein VL461_11575 [Dictyobacter sp.]|jgi:hypothetical protein|nr:hypothetical protein [Dictyobacter sp.]